LKKIGLVTSGGDAPGMNAAIRAVVRFAIPRGLDIIGFERGYQGLIEDQTIPLGLRSVARIINIGGTILKTIRCPEFKTKEGLERSNEVLKEHSIDGLVVIGGDGSFRGGLALSGITDIPVIGIPATIDNDVAGTETTIGFDTAVNTAVDAIDKIRDTAISHERAFIVEVMGKDRGFIALEVGLTSGAEVILVPEVSTDLDTISNKLLDARRRGKTSNIVVMAEGIGNTMEIVNHIERETQFEVRLTKLGHIQRGGSPTARSRLIADLLGVAAVENLLNEKKNLMVGIKRGRVSTVGLKYACTVKKPLDLDLLRLAEELAA
jgi:6-phosphofructokinase 1